MSISERSDELQKEYLLTQNAGNEITLAPDPPIRPNKTPKPDGTPKPEPTDKPDRGGGKGGGTPK
jgi:hypothetical protein